MNLSNLFTRCAGWARRHVRAVTLVSVVLLVGLTGSTAVITTAPSPDAPPVTTLVGARNAIAERLGVREDPAAVPIGHMCGWTLYISLSTDHPTSSEPLQSIDLGGTVMAQLVGWVGNLQIFAERRNVPAFLTVTPTGLGEPATMILADGGAVVVEEENIGATAAILYPKALPSHEVSSAPVVNEQEQLLTLVIPYPDVDMGTNAVDPSTISAALDPVNLHGPVTACLV